MIVTIDETMVCPSTRLRRKTEQNMVLKGPARPQTANGVCQSLQTHVIAFFDNKDLISTTIAPREETVNS